MYPRDASGAVTLARSGPRVGRPGGARTQSERPEIAVVGMACRLPGAPDPDALWAVLAQGRETLDTLPDGRLGRSTPVDPERAPGHIVTARGGFLEDIERFDAGFFGISPREAKRIDPQQRLLLEVAYEAFEDAGWTLESLAGSRTGVFVGQWTDDYAERIRRSTDDHDLYSVTGSGRYASSGRLAYVFDLRGPAMTVDTACSSSLVALHLARRSMLAGECERAIVAGVNLLLEPSISIGYSKSRVLSAQGRCRFADDAADGYVRSEGVGVVVLTSVARAEAAGDPIRAIVLGTATGSDGRASGSLVAPALVSQIDTLRAACADAGIEGREVTYVEAHGTGTPVGDAVEIEALAAVLGEGRSADAPCHIGSLKTNIGHCEAASGVAGLIKAVLCVERGELPRSLNFETPSRRIPWHATPLRVPTEHRAWPPGSPRIAGVNAFGITGANAHAIIAGYGSTSDRPTSADGFRGVSAPEAAPAVFPVSAASAPALEEALLRLADHVECSAPRPSLVDLCHTAGLRRSRLPFRAAVVARSPDTLAHALRHAASAALQATARTEAPRVHAVCRGLEGLCPGAGRALLRAEPAMAAAAEMLDGAIGRRGAWSIAAVLDGGPADWGSVDPLVARGCVVAWHVGLIRLLEAWNVRLDGFEGTGVGQASADVLAGRLPLDQLVSRLAVGRLRPPTAAGGCAAGVELHIQRGGERGDVVERRIVLLDPEAEDPASLYKCAAALFELGVDLDFGRVNPPGRHTRLPPYPWQRAPYWFSTPGGGPARDPSGEAAGEPPDPPGRQRTERLSASLTRCAPEDRVERIERSLRAWIGEELECAPEAIDADVPLGQLGLDSLMAVRLLARVEAEFGFRPSLSRALGREGLRGLASSIATRVPVARRPSGATSPPAELAPGEAARALENLDALTDEQIADLLEKLSDRRIHS